MDWHLKELAKILYVAAAYGLAIYFATTALLPTLALHCAFGGAILAVLGYIVLVITDQADEGMISGFFLTFPVAILFLGIVWWVARLLGGWELF